MMLSLSQYREQYSKFKRLPIADFQIRFGSAELSKIFRNYDYFVDGNRVFVYLKR